MIKHRDFLLASLLPIACLFAPSLAAGQAGAQPEAPAQTAPTIDSTIETLVNNAQSRPILDRHFPGLSTHASYPQFKGFTIRQLSQHAPTQITAAKIEALDADLRALPRQ